jgi:uncharacterized membrane protein YecN with MAPEG domain
MFPVHFIYLNIETLILILDQVLHLSSPKERQKRKRSLQSVTTYGSKLLSLLLLLYL